MLFDLKEGLRSFKMWPWGYNPATDHIYKLKTKIDEVLQNYFSLEKILSIGILEENMAKYKAEQYIAKFMKKKPCDGHKRHLVLPHKTTNYGKPHTHGLVNSLKKRDESKDESIKSHSY